MTSPWFVPFRPSGDWADETLSRRWIREGGGVWTADSPRMLFDLSSCSRKSAMMDVIAGHLGERPALSVRKSTLRRTPAEITRADWHQDGAFLGGQVRTVNVWLGLTDCGDETDAPGLDIVPRRIPDVLETGTDGAWFDWSVGEAVVERQARTAAVVRPRLAAGDAVLFDHLMLHRTAARPGLTRDRYAIESWFFAPSTFPGYQIPVVV